MTSLHEFTALDITGEPQDLSQYAGQAVLVVNTASQCGFTPQYEGLEELHRRFGSRGFAVLGFPCDQFGHQEPGSEGEIAQFCESHFGVSFPMFAKVEVNGAGAHPLYQWLRSEKSGLLGNKIKWNFTKFLVDANGSVVKRYGSMTKPADIADDIEAILPA